MAKSESLHRGSLEKMADSPSWGGLFSEVFFSEKLSEKAGTNKAQGGSRRIDSAYLLNKD